MVDIDRVIKEYIEKEFLFDKPEMVLDNDMPLVEQGIVDSLGILRLVAFLENEFEVKINPDDVILENFGTIDAMKRFVAAKLRSRSLA
jgi:acyl carrier protein